MIRRELSGHGCRSNGASPELFGGLTWFKVRQARPGFRQRRRHGFQLVEVSLAVRARGEVACQTVFLRLGQDAAGQQSDAPAVAPTGIEEPFHTG
jgi:hypothetical protein